MKRTPLARILPLAALGLVAALLAARPARACDIYYATKVIGFSADGHTAVVRMEGDGAEWQLFIALVDLKQSKELKRFDIVAPERGIGEEQRKANWQRVSRTLEKQGYTIDGQYPELPGPPFKLESEGIEIYLQKSSDEDGMTERTDVRARKGKLDVLVKASLYNQMPSATEMGWVDKGYVDPQRRYLLLIDRGACNSRTVTALKLDEIRGKLGGK